MIDEQSTWVLFGYFSTNLSYGSDKHIIAICPECQKRRELPYRSYTQSKAKLCKKCSQSSQSTRDKISKNHADMSGKNNPFYGKHHTKESKLKAVANRVYTRGEDHFRFGVKHLNASLLKMSEAKIGNITSLETRIKQSASAQGISIDEWVEFKDSDIYPTEFNIELKTHIREMYDDRCFLCNKTSIENKQELSVHHIDRDKQNSNVNNLIPLCVSCHSLSHTLKYISIYTYLLQIEGAKHET